MKKFLKAFYTHPRLYLSAAVLILIYIFGYFFDTLFFLAKIATAILLFLVVLDFFLLYISRPEGLLLKREIPDRLSNGDENSILLYLKNNYPFPVSVRLTDEIPYQFHIRDFMIMETLKPAEEKRLNYHLKPVERGIYNFGSTNAYVASPVGLLLRRYQYDRQGKDVPVYPSFLRMRDYELLAISNRLTEVGVKRIRRIGTQTEFDQIKDYVKGDNYRTINWKATAKRGRLMVNQYQDERSQQVYNMIDMGRIMKMPFDGMTLLDYAINSSLVISNTALLRHDKAGLLTFNTRVEAFMPAERRNSTISRLLELLYNQQTKFLESDYMSVTAYIRRQVTHRSLIILYTNFETLSGLERQINALRNIARNHLLLVVIFENTGIHELTSAPADTLREVYTKTIAEKFIYDKHLIIRELARNGILSVFTPPAQLTTRLINKYLELKAVGRF